MAASPSPARFARAFARYADLIPDFTAFVDAVGRDAPGYVRVNTLKADLDDVCHGLRRCGWEPVSSPLWAPLLTLCGSGDVAVGATLLHALGHIYVQSASSALAALALGVRPQQRVLDLCAAPGSKTTLLAQQMEDRGLLVANEPNRRRSRSLISNLERLGITCAVVTAYSGQNFPLRGCFHRVLVDAPCSGEGTWRGPRGRPQSVSARLRSHLHKQQRALLARGYALLEPGGVLVYSTCTYAPEENEAVLAGLLADSDAQLEPLPLDVPGEPGLAHWQGESYPQDLQHARRLYPHLFPSEGFFVARVVKP